MYFLFILFAIILVSVAIGRKITLEGFKSSSEQQVSEGASGMYRWGYQPIEPVVEDVEIIVDEEKKKHEKCPKCGYKYYTTYNINYETLPDCSKCDITKNPDIDKYVLKSSIPPCPNMSEYVKKSEQCPCVDMKDYIRKSDIPPYYVSNYNNESILRPDDWFSSYGDVNLPWYSDNAAKANYNADFASGMNANINFNTKGVKPYNAIGEIV